MTTRTVPLAFRGSPAILALVIGAGSLGFAGGCDQQSPPPASSGGGGGGGGNGGAGSNSGGSGSTPTDHPTTTSGTAGNADPSGPAGGVSHQPKSLLGRSADTARTTRQAISDRSSEAASAASEITGEGQALEFNGIKFVAPADWKKIPASGMRAAELKAQAPEMEGPEGACTLVVFTFKPGEGGNSQMNIDRWVQQFKTSGGTIPEPEVGRRTISGMQVTTVALDGTYTEMMPSGAASAAKPNWGFRGAIVESSRGNVVLRFTGPKAAVDALQPRWSAMIDGLTK